MVTTTKGRIANHNLISIDLGVWQKSLLCVCSMHRQLNTKDPVLHISPTNSQQVKLPTNANEAAPCPTKQDQISCANFGQQVFHQLITHSTQLSNQQLRSTGQHRVCTATMPFAIQKLQWRAGNSPKLECIHTLINWTAPCFDWIETLSGRGGWGSRSALTR